MLEEVVRGLHAGDSGHEWGFQAASPAGAGRRHSRKILVAMSGEARRQWGASIGIPIGRLICSGYSVGGRGNEKGAPAPPVARGSVQSPR